MLLYSTEPTGRMAARGRGMLWEYPMSRDGKKSPFGRSQQSSQMAGDKTHSENSTICLQLRTHKKGECSECLSTLWSDVEQLEQRGGHGHTLSKVGNVHVQDASLPNVPKEEFIYSLKKQEQPEFTFLCSGGLSFEMGVGHPQKNGQRDLFPALFLEMEVWIWWCELAAASWEGLQNRGKVGGWSSQTQGWYLLVPCWSHPMNGVCTM